jgi:hypothetical protein
VENQIFLHLISLSPLTTIYPSMFRHTRVQSINLIMVSSSSFGSTNNNYVSSFYVAFATHLCLLLFVSCWFIMQKVHRSRLAWSIDTNSLFLFLSKPLTSIFHHSPTVLIRYLVTTVLRFRGWAPCIRKV